MSDDFDLGHLYDGEDTSEIGGGHLFDGHDEVRKHVPDDMLHRDLLVCENMMPLVTCHGNTTVPRYFDANGNTADPATVSEWLYTDDPRLGELTPDVHYVYGNIVGRTQKNSVMSENWAQDTTPTSVGGNREMNQIKILVPEWHGDFYSRIWFQGSCYEVDGSPVELPHSSELARHWEFPARRVYAAELARNKVSAPVPVEGAAVWGM